MPKFRIDASRTDTVRYEEFTILAETAEEAFLRANAKIHRGDVQGCADTEIIIRPHRCEDPGSG